MRQLSPPPLTSATRALMLLALITAPTIAWADPIGPSAPLEAWHEARDARLTAGMGTLLAWGLLNTTAGTIGRATATTDRGRGFWEMNLGWGLINSALAGVSLLTMGADADTRASIGASLEASHDMALVLWVNTGLDVAYIALGAWLWERGLARGQERTVGFGQSLIVQGAFLFGFDLVMALLEGSHAGQLYPLLGPQQVGVGLRF